MITSMKDFVEFMLFYADSFDSWSSFCDIIYSYIKIKTRLKNCDINTLWFKETNFTKWAPSVKQKSIIMTSQSVKNLLMKEKTLKKNSIFHGEVEMYLQVN